MKKKEYEQPKTDVVELRVTCQLLAGSANANGLLDDSTDYDPQPDPFSF